MTFVPDNNEPGYRIVRNVLSDLETSDLFRSLETSHLTRSRAGTRQLLPKPPLLRGRSLWTTLSGFESLPPSQKNPSGLPFAAQQSTNRGVPPECRREVFQRQKNLIPHRDRRVALSRAGTTGTPSDPTSNEPLSVHQPSR